MRFAFGASIPAISITNDAKFLLGLALGDVDGDGDLDLVTGNTGQANRFYRNNGTSVPWLTSVGSDVGADAHQTHTVALGDVDGDGDLDLVAGNFSEPNRLYLNNGTTDPWNGVTGADITTDAGSTTFVLLRDVDGDGDLDLIAANRNERNRLYLNNGTADPWNGVSGSDITTDAGETTSLALGDVDRDGDLDLVAGNDGQRNRLYLNNGTANPWSGVAGSDITTDAGATWSIALGDADGDGHLDLVAGNLGQRNRLYRNNGTANPWSGVSGSDVTLDADDTYGVALGDVDRDGDLDLMVGNGGQTNRLYLNDGTADPWGSAAGTDIRAHTDDTRALALVDIDADGDVDLVAGNFGQRNWYYRNDGIDLGWDGVTAFDVGSDTPPAYSVAVGDIDRDGDLDMVFGNFGVENTVYLNNGTSTPFTPLTAYLLSGRRDTYDVALGDVDGDGDLDLVAGNFNGLPNMLYLNDGTATPFLGAAGISISTDLDKTIDVALGDVDNDGDLDMVAGNSARDRLYLNNGTANPWNGVAGIDVSILSEPTRTLVLGDVDNDGDLDLIVGGYDFQGAEIQPNRLYLNNGTESPWGGVTPVSITNDAFDPQSLALGDVDRDGDLDLISGNSNSFRNRLYLNNGTADPWNGVSGTDISSIEHNTHHAELADIDGDGDLDLLIGWFNGRTAFT